ncbi:TPA_exp: putative Transcription factor RfeG [Trichophyton benhamiae CBS 112371]|nr:TPA_exp: putative Transcription factor RfeG [Trichophyton benhamiae CBS 112371]
MAQRQPIRYDDPEPQTRLNEYFIDQDGISREVIQADICRYLGRDALVRPGTHQGRPGYFIRAYRNLTTEMIADLKADSRRWDVEVRSRQEGGQPRGTYYDTYNTPPVPNRSPANYDSSSVRPRPPVAYSSSRPQQPQQPSYSTYPPTQPYPAHQPQPSYQDYGTQPGYPQEGSSYVPSGGPPYSTQSTPPVTTAEQSYIHSQGAYAYPGGISQPRYSGQGYENDRDYSPVGQSTSPYPPSTGPDPRIMETGYPVESAYQDRQPDRGHPRNPAPRH